MSHLKSEAPPLAGGASEKRFDGQSKTFSEYSDELHFSQGPRHIGEIVDALLRRIVENAIEVDVSESGGAS